MIPTYLRRLVFFAACAALAHAVAPESTVTGTMFDPATSQPAEFVAVTLKKADGAVVQSTVSDRRGRFTLEKIPAGDYVVSYSHIGADVRSTERFTLDAQHLRLDLGRLSLGETAVQLEKFQVQSTKTAQLNGIDRKTYNVGKEIQSATGSASDLLQNIPSVQVDIDGNISLRGSENVLILIDGRTSALMGKTRAEVLQQLPAEAIEKIEVITNPSAKYKPDGTAGIINIALRKKHDPGFSSTATVGVGNAARSSAGLAANYHPATWNLFGAYNLRQDDRARTASDFRTITDPLTGAVTTAEKNGTEHSRPLSHLARAGADWRPGARDQLGVGASFNRRTLARTATEQNLIRDARAVVTSDYDRLRYTPEFEEEAEATANWQHTFAEEGHELGLDFKATLRRENEDNFYTNRYRTPATPESADNKLIHTREHGTETSLAYVRPLANDAKLEAGYTRTSVSLDANFRSENLDPASGQFLADPAQSNRFRTASVIHAFYGTYARTVGQFGFLAGVRPEFTAIESHLITTNTTVPNNYARVYPSLHLSYQLNEANELQLNYSHRVHRPEIDDLNPFPEYIDPFNLRAGNPRLLPEDIHSIEAGWAWKHDETSLTSTVYHRNLYHGFAAITRPLGGGVLLTTRENLAESRATGLELTANTDLGKIATLNFSSNTYFNTLDASNLGYSATKSDISWSAKVGATVHLPRDTLFQFNTNYASARLTPQGSRHPAFVANAGLRHEFWAKKAAVVLTVSDLFNSLKEGSSINTPLLRQEIVRRRSARIVQVGFTYNFGKAAKKSKDDSLKFDNTL